MNYIKKLLWLVLFFAFACEEDTIEPDFYGNLTGVVLDNTTGQPIANADISTNPATTTLVSDAEGKFDFGKVKIGNYGVRVEKNGYSLNVEAILVETDKMTNVVTRL